jgi:N-acyl-D-amino-acid deacylase
MFDIILRNGQIADGSGQPSYPADVGIKGDRIAAIGDLSGLEAGSEVDVAGRIVAPGFIDIHTHSDAILLADSHADSQILQGVTTEMGGQCGFSFAPVRNSQAMEKWMVGRLPGVNATWQSFGEYLDVLGQKELGVNFLAHVGHGALRAAVMGDEERPITAEELSMMDALLEESLEQGAWGMSTGLEYWPGLGAGIEELTRLCRTVARHEGIHASHVRNRDIYYDMGFGEALTLGRVAGVKTQISHIQPKYGRPDHAMAHTLDMIDHARSIGVDVGFDVIPHDWSHTAVAAMLPAWSREGGVESFVERLRDPATRRKIKETLAPMWRIVVDGHWDKVVFLGATNDAIIGRSVAELLEEYDAEPWDLIFDLLRDEGSDALKMLWTSQSFFEEDIDLALRHSCCSVMSDTLALGDDGPTAGVIGSLSGFDWTVRFLNHYVLGKKLMSLEEGVRRLSGLPADQIGLLDRGYIRAGLKADITVFDPAALAFHGSVKAPRQHPEGVSHVLVNGKAAVKDGRRQAVYVGEVLRSTP